MSPADDTAAANKSGEPKPKVPQGASRLQGSLKVIGGSMSDDWNSVASQWRSLKIQSGNNGPLTNGL